MRERSRGVSDVIIASRVGNLVSLYKVLRESKGIEGTRTVPTKQGSRGIPLV